MGYLRPHITACILLMKHTIQAKLWSNTVVSNRERIVKSDLHFKTAPNYLIRVRLATNLAEIQIIYV